MLTISDMIEELNHLDADVFLELCDRLRKLGGLEEIKEKVSEELFNLYIGINIIGIWKSDGWCNILAENADFVPYISAALQELELEEIRNAFENVLSLFPEETVFKSDCSNYYDIYNFLTIFDYKVENEKLKLIDPQKKREMVKQTREKIVFLEKLTSQYWEYHCERDGWKQIIDYIHKKVLH